MIPKRIFVYLLLLSLTIPLLTIHSTPNQNSVTLTTYTVSSTLTSQGTYTQGVTQVISTTTNTIYDGILALPGWTVGGCTFADFPFNANPGDEVSVNFQSNYPIDIYLMSAGQFQRVPAPSALCNYFMAIPVFPSLKHASYQTSYSFNWSPTTAGQLHLVLFNFQPAQASVSFTAQLTTSQMVSSTLYSTSTSLLTVMTTQTLSSIVTALSPSSSQTVGQNLWIIIPFLILIGLAITFFMKRKKP